MNSSFPHAVAVSLPNMASLLFFPPRFRRRFWLIEYLAQSTHVRTFSYNCDCSWSVMSFFLPDSHQIPARDQLATPAVQYPPMPPGLVSNRRPRPAGFVAIPATVRARGDSVNDTPVSAENVSGAREAREHIQPRSIGDAKTILMFVSPVQLILCFCLLLY